ncbi:MAG: type II secretion system protein [Phycisphaerae bacterium]
MMNSASATISNPRKSRANRNGSRRAAFTIVELVVSIGILGIMLVMAGAIFTLTLKSSGEANAIIEIGQSVRAVEDTLTKDLRNAGNTILVIQGNPIPAYMTLAELEVDTDGDPSTSLVRDPVREYVDASDVIRHETPRADMLMFFTKRPGSSFRDPSISGRLQQVVYGHAELGIWDTATGVWSRTPIAFPTMGSFDSNMANDKPLPNGPFDSTRFPPAHDWLLTRRSVLILDQPGPFNAVPPALSLDDSAAVLGGSDDETKYSAASAANRIRDGRRDFVVNTVVDTLNSVNNPTEDFRYVDYVLKMTASDPLTIGREVALDPNDCCGAAGTYPNFVVNQFSTPENFRHWIVPWFARSQLDPNPPANQSERLGHYLMPNCAGFKVEWALTWTSETDPVVKECLDLFDDTIWVDPADIGATADLIDGKIAELNANPALADQLAMCGVAGAPLDRLYQLFTDPLGRFSSQIMGTNHLFYAKNPDPTSGSSLSDPFFPSALRVTIDVFDTSERLERPIRHVMIIPIDG